MKNTETKKSRIESMKSAMRDQFEESLNHFYQEAYQDIIDVLNFRFDGSSLEINVCGSQFVEYLTFKSILKNTFESWDSILEDESQAEYCEELAGEFDKMAALLKRRAKSKKK